MSEFIYVSAVKGALVPRFPTVGGVILFIGATRSAKTITWDTDAIVRIPRTEWLKYRREYARAIASGALRERTEAEYNAREQAGSEPAQHEADQSATEGDTQ